MHTHCKARGTQAGADFVFEVGVQAIGRARVLALGSVSHTARQISHKTTVVSMTACCRQQCSASLGDAVQDGLTRLKCSTTGGDAKKGPTMARHWENNGPWRKPTVWSSSVSQKICST